MDQHDPNRTPTLDSTAPPSTGSHIETDPVDDTATTNAAQSTTEATEATDDLSYEERAQFAGVNVDDDDELVTTDELMAAPSTAAGRGAENSPLTRLGFVGSALGAIALMVWILSGFFSAGQQQAQEDTDGDAPLPEESATTFGEDDRMRAELALIEQDQAETPSRRAQTPPRQTTTASTPTETSPTQTTTAPPEPTPAPRVRRTQPTPPPPPQPAPPAPAASPTLTNTPEASDPLATWNRLSTAGASGTTVALTPAPNLQTPQAAEPPPPTSEPTDRAAQTSATDTASPLPTDRVGDDPIARPSQRTNRAAQDELLVASNSPGAQGIIRQQPVEASSNRTRTVQQVAVGSSAAGEVVVPIIYAGGDFSAQGRFAVELTAPLRDVNGRVALETGTLLITQVSAVLNSNILQQQVIAVVYEGTNGQVRQETLESGVLVIRGPNNQPLVAQVRNNSADDSLGQDLLVGGLSALGNIGAVINAPEAITTATSGATGGRTQTQTTTTVTSGRDNNLWGAALEGFFTPISERVSERFDPRNQDPTQPYLYVPQGQTVSVFVNGVLEVTP